MKAPGYAFAPDHHQVHSATQPSQQLASLDHTHLDVPTSLHILLRTLSFLTPSLNSFVLLWSQKCYGPKRC